MAILKGLLVLVQKEWVEVILEIEGRVQKIYKRALFPYKKL